VGVIVAVGIGVLVGVGVAVAVAREVGVGTAVAVGVAVCVGVAGSGVGAAVGPAVAVGKGLGREIGLAETTASGLASEIPRAAPCVTTPCVTRMPSAETVSTGVGSLLVGVAAILVGSAVAVGGSVGFGAGVGGSAGVVGRTGAALKVKLDAAASELPDTGNVTGVGIGDGIRNFEPGMLCGGSATNPAPVCAVPALAVMSASSPLPLACCQTRKASSISRINRRQSVPISAH
jgi:hypothetical protein